MAHHDLLGWLGEMARRKGTDIYLTHGAPPTMRGDDGLVRLTDWNLDDRALSAIVGDLTTAEQLAAFGSEGECNLSLDLGDTGRFRVNVFRQRRHQGLVIRRIEARVPTVAELGLPPVLVDLVMERRGLVIMVGGTGSGKSTSLAAMIDHRNSIEAGHILTIEDPIEYVHEHKMCLVTQREVGSDTRSFEAALKNSLRQKPDVILVGEIRDAATMRHALNISETGHLALATLHANNADQAVDRIGNFFEPEERRSVLLNLAFNLRGICSQRLVRATGGGRALALEIVINRGGVQDAIRTGDTRALKAEMRAGAALGMSTFDKALLDLWRAGRIDEIVATSECDDRDWMSERMREAGADTVTAAGEESP